MDAKLTLKLNETVIEKAKRYAKSKNQSLSQLVENFLKSLTEDFEQDRTHYGLLTEELSGVIDAAKVESLQEQYCEYLVEKYK